MSSNFRLLVRKVVHFQCSEYLTELTQHAKKFNGFISSVNFTESYLPVDGDKTKQEKNMPNHDEPDFVTSDFVTVNTISEWKSRDNAFDWVHSNERTNIKTKYEEVVINETYGILREMNVGCYNVPLL